MDTTKYLSYIKDYQIAIDNIVPLNGNVPGLNLKLLNKRLHDAKEAFLCLHYKNMHMDAMLIAGHILEICAAIYYIKSAKDKLLNTRIYVAKSTVQSLYDLLNVDKTEQQDKLYKDTINDFLNYLEDMGHLVLKPINKENKKEFNKQIVAKIRSENLTNIEKTKLIKKYYDKPIVNDSIVSFIEGMKERAKNNPNENVQKIEEAMNLFYVSYCRIKHASALLYPGHLEKNHIIIDDNKPELSIPAVFLCLDMISDNPVHLI
jgi:hypothetical protein